MSRSSKVTPKMDKKIKDSYSEKIRTNILKANSSSSGVKCQNLISPISSRNESHEEKNCLRDRIGLPVCQLTSSLQSPMKKFSQKETSMSSTNKLFSSPRVSNSSLHPIKKSAQKETGMLCTSKMFSSPRTKNPPQSPMRTSAQKETSMPSTNKLSSQRTGNPPQSPMRKSAQKETSISSTRKFNSPRTGNPQQSPMRKSFQKETGMPSTNKTFSSPKDRKLSNKHVRFTLAEKKHCGSETNKSHVKSFESRIESSLELSTDCSLKGNCNYIPDESKCVPISPVFEQFNENVLTPCVCNIFHEVQIKQTVSNSMECSHQNTGEINIKHQSKITVENTEVSSIGKKTEDISEQRSIMDSPSLTQNFNNADVSSVLNKKWSNQVSSTVIVAVRVRPFTNKEKSDDQVHCAVSMKERTTTVTVDGSHQYTFSFDHCLWSFDSDHTLYARQSQVYQLVAAPLLQHAFEGYNTCLFAYGQTGSGKSYTVMGNSDKEGIIPRFCRQLFDRVKRISEDKVTCLVEVSYFEIYNEKIYDLLTCSEEYGKKKTLRVREHPVQGPYVEDLSTYTVSCYEDLKGWLELGNKQRATACTAMNDHSSRSHSIFMITLTQSKIEKIKGEDHEHSTISHINIVDLAGSERVSTAQTSGERLKEGVSINRSLLTLGKVIAQLADQSNYSGGDTPKKSIFIPYRESVLTWLLKESLGGNSHTVMVTTISPSNFSIEETLSSLRYATQARRIVNRARINEDPKARLIKELQAEIEKLRQNNQALPINCEVYEKEISFLKLHLATLKVELEQSKKSWQEKLELAEANMKDQIEKLEKQGIAVQITEVTPWLVNLHEDPQLSETLTYVLQPGQKTVGNFADVSTADIQLHGNLISEEHCSFWNREGIVTVMPANDASVYVNGSLVNESTILNHGDRVVLGGDQFFRFHNPCDAQQTQDMKGFDFAYQELSQQQEVRMKEELAVSVEKTCQEAIEQLEDIRQEVELSFRKQSFEDQSEEQMKSTCCSSTSTFPKQPSIEEEFVPWKSDLLEWITDTFPDVFSNISQIKADIKSTSTSDSIKDEENLYELSLKLKEANKLAKKLNFNVELNQCHVITDSGLEQVIKVHKNDLGIVTYWSLPEFTKRLARFHELNEMAISDLDDVFDITDIWDTESSALTHFHPGSHLYKKLKEAQNGEYTSKLGNVSNLSSSNSLSSPILSSVQHSRGAFSTTCLSMDRQDVVSVFCSLMTEQVDEISDWTVENISVVDPAIDVICKLLSSIAALKDFIGMNTDYMVKSCSTLMGVFNQFHAVIYYILTQWSFQVEHSRFNKLISRTEDQSVTRSAKESVLRVAKSVAFMFQGIEKCVESMVIQYNKKAKKAVLSLVPLVGRISIDLHIVLNWQKLEKHSDIASAIVQGAEEHVSVILKTAIFVTDECILQLDAILEDSFFGPVWNSQILHCTKEIIGLLGTWFNKCIMWKNSWMMDCLPEKYNRHIKISESVLPTVDLLQYLVQEVESLVKGSVYTFENNKLLRVLQGLESNMLLIILPPSSKFDVSGRLELSRQDAIAAIHTLRGVLEQFENGSESNNSLLKTNSAKKSFRQTNFSTVSDRSHFTGSSNNGNSSLQEVEALNVYSSIFNQDDVIDF